MKNLKLPLQVLIVILFFSFTINYLSAQTTIEVSGEIQNDTVWNADTVKVTGDISINPLVTLTIKPGVVVQFQGPYEISVKGTLDAIGNSDSIILFTVKDTTGFSNHESDSGYWRGILYNGYPLGEIQGNTSDFEYCIEAEHNMERFLYIRAECETESGKLCFTNPVWID